MDQPYIFETNNFKQPLIWIQRAAESLLAVAFIYWIDLRSIEQGSDLIWIGYSFAGFVSLYILLRPMDELALDQEKLYYIQRSIFPFFNRRREYLISNIKNIKSSGAFSPRLPMYAFVPEVINRSKIEITFNDNRLERRGLTISQRKVDKIISEVRVMVQ